MIRIRKTFKRESQEALFDIVISKEGDILLLDMKSMKDYRKAKHSKAELFANKRLKIMGSMVFEDSVNEISKINEMFKTGMSFSTFYTMAFLTPQTNYKSLLSNAAVENGTIEEAIERMEK